MTWAIYTQLTSHSRVAESIVAIFALFWAAWVATLIGQGGTPMRWVGLDGPWQYLVPAALCASGLLHVAGLRLIHIMPLSAIMRAVGLAGMALVFGSLSYIGMQSSAGPTYFAFASACFGGAFNAARDARYAKELPNGRNADR